MADLVANARRFATLAHQRIDHRRKYSKQPYDVHLKAVAQIVASVSDDPEMLAAAWLHDVVEDTPATLEELEREFGPGVAGLVKELTDVSRPGDGNRSARKAIDRAHLATASPRAKTIKLADLCDNARDICAADPHFARVYLREMAALLEVLGDGDARLMRRARRIHGECQAALQPLPEAADHAPTELSEQQAAQLRAVWRQMNTFTVRDLARPLPSLDVSQPAPQATGIMAEKGWTLIGLRRNGMIAGYMLAGDSGSETCAQRLRHIEPEQILDNSAPLSAMVHVLTHHDYAFVRALGQIGGVLSRADLEQPIGRMWLFGMITLMDMDFSDRIRKRWPEGEWQDLLSEGRLEKARLLQAERGRRGHLAELLDCLQLSDKATILMEDPEQMAQWGFASKRAAQARLRDLESLRNHLAHSQDIVSHHWHQIARMTQRFEEALLDYMAPEDGRRPFATR
jgi:hypothetical protein